MGQRGTQQGRRLRLWLPLMHGHSHGDSSHHPRRPRVRQFGVARCVALLNDGGVCQMLDRNAAAVLDVNAVLAAAVQRMQEKGIVGMCARKRLASEPQPAPQRQVVYPLHQKDNEHQRSRLHRHSSPYSQTTSYYCIARLIFSIAKQHRRELYPHAVARYFSFSVFCVWEPRINYTPYGITLAKINR